MVGIAKDNDKRKTKGGPLTSCKKCGASVHIRARVCPNCKIERYPLKHKSKDDDSDQPLEN